MKRRLFFTGEMGVGKSTAIASAVGAKSSAFGGFLTRRNLGQDGRAVSFSLEVPDGSREEIFLEFSSGKPDIRLAVFETLGIQCLQGDVLVLDEIGGVELLSPHFAQRLEDVLRSDTPVLGVLKGKSPSHALAETLGLSEEYRLQTEKLWQLLSEDRGTMIYPCEKYDEKALTLAQQWVREYCL